MNRGGRLRIAEVGEHLALLIRNLGGCERAPILRFLNGRTHHGNTRGVNGDEGIEEGGVVAAPQVMMRPCHAASVGPGKKRSVGHEVEGHCRGPEDFHSVAMSGREAKKAVQVGHGRKSGMGLCAGQRTGS